MLPLPSSVTGSPSSTVRLVPAFAVGGSLSARTVTVTVSLADNPPGSVTVNRKVRTVSEASCDMENVGRAVAASLSVTVGDPPVWVQA